MEHLLDHMIGPNAKNLVADFSGQMPVSQMPGKAYELIGIFMPDLDNRLRSGLDHEQSSIFKLQAISIRHRNRVRKVEKDSLALVGHQANAAAVARVEIEGERARRSFLRPMSRGPVNGGMMHRRCQYMK
jgi:hypothetical protein